MKDPEGPFLCLPKIFDLRSDITTKALAENGLGGRRQRAGRELQNPGLGAEDFHARAQPRHVRGVSQGGADATRAGSIGKSIVFAVNQTHATNLTKIFNELQPGIAVTITSRIPDASSIAKEFRDGKRPERIAVSVDMLSTGYNCRDLLNIGLMRPIFSPTEYIQIKGRGTRLYTFKIGNTEYEKKNFFLLDFCAVAEYFEEKYDYTRAAQAAARARRSRSRTTHPASGGGAPVTSEGRRADSAGTAPTAARDSRSGKARTSLVSREVTKSGRTARRWT